VLSGRVVPQRIRSALRSATKNNRTPIIEAGTVPGLPLPLSGRTELFAIVGDPILQAGSPIVFNTAFRQLGRHAVLVPVQVSPAGFSSFLDGMRQVQNLRGLIVTKPHKTNALAYVDSLGPNARQARSVNAIRCEPDGVWVGENFDGIGCIAGLKAAAEDLAGKRVLLIGTGGAGRAVSFAIAHAGVSRLRLFDVNSEEAARVCEDLRQDVPGLTVETGEPDPSGYDVIVNCTPLGMVPADLLPLDPGKLKPGSLVIDLVVEPNITPLLQAALDRSCRVHTGSHTLMGQVNAILAFFGCIPDGGDQKFYLQHL
jgi:shikimate dehydrogenase